jgi:hypothetical protein
VNEVVEGSRAAEMRQMDMVKSKITRIAQGKILIIYVDVIKPNASLLYARIALLYLSAGMIILCILYVTTTLCYD